LSVNISSGFAGYHGPGDDFVIWQLVIPDFVIPRERPCDYLAVQV